MRLFIYKTLFHPLAIVLLIVLCSIVTYFSGGLGTVLGIIVALIAIWSGGFEWSLFGINKFDFFETLSNAFIYAVLIFFIFDILVQPFIELVWGKIDISSLDFIRGDLSKYFLFVLMMWILAAFGEEFLYRGYFMKQIALLFGNNNRSWIISAAIIGVVFGLAHAYQGMSGMVITGLIGFVFGLIFSKNQQNLPLVVLIHGIYDMIGLTLIYLDSERVLADYIISLIQ